MFWHLYGRERIVGPERYTAAHLRLHAPAPSSPHLLLEKLGDPAVNTPPPPPYAEVI